MSEFRVLLKTEALILLRERMTLFFTLLFPLIFILIFGFIMGDLNEESATLGLWIGEEVDKDILEETLIGLRLQEVTRFDTKEELDEAVAKRSVDFGLAWDGDRLKFYYDPSRVQENYAFAQIAQGIANDFNLRNQGLSPVLSVKKLHVGTSAATSWLNIMIPGILAFSVLSAGLFAVSGHITAMKERKILDRMVVTPMHPLALLAAIICVRLVVIYLSSLITLFTALLIFDVRFTIDWMYYSIFIVCATLGTMGLGTVIALLVRRPSSASNIANVLAILMMFLSGIYFPIEFMPAFLRAVSKALPLTYMAEALRFTTGVVEMSLSRFWGITAALLALALVLLPLLARYVVQADRG
jgi:ABC-2 type transport system permease protein